jgi:hypothetical protein
MGTSREILDRIKAKEAARTAGFWRTTDHPIYRELAFKLRYAPEQYSAEFKRALERWRNRNSMSKDKFYGDINLGKFPGDSLQAATRHAVKEVALIAVCERPEELKTLLDPNWQPPRTFSDAEIDEVLQSWDFTGIIAQAFNALSEGEEQYEEALRGNSASGSDGEPSELPAARRSGLRSAQS